MASNPDGGRVTLLVTSPRVAPGLLSGPAWDAIRGADRVLAGDPEHPQRSAVEESGTPVEVVEPARLRDAASTAGRVVWLAADAAEAAALRADLAGPSDGGAPCEVDVVTGSYDLPGGGVVDLVAAMDLMRQRCPWDSRQTHASLLRYLLEETYETIEAVETGDRDHVREELGDLLLQVVFHSRIAQEHPDAPWSFDDVAADITAKMIRRHPHVFGDTPADEVDWESGKAAEKRRSSALDGVPPGLPALALADKVLGRLGGSAVPVPVPPDPVPGLVGDAADLGEVLLGVVGAARSRDLDPEQALRQAVRRLADRVRRAERSPG